MRLTNTGGAPRSEALRMGCASLLLLLLFFAASAAAEAPAPAPRAIDNMMSAQGWLQQIVIKLEDEAINDFHVLPEIPGALALEWRSFDRQGSALGALVNV